MSPARMAVVGAFVVGGILLFGVGLFFVGDRRLLFAKQFEMTCTFGKVTGLQVGTRARLAGLNAGEVLEIRLPTGPSDRFRVRMRLRDDVRHLVRADSVCAVQTDGIVGNAFVQISVGTEGARVVSPGDTLAGNDPIEIGDLVRDGRDTFRTVSREMVDLKGEMSEALAALISTAHAANGLLADVGRDVKTLTAVGTRAVEDVRATIGDARAVVADVKAGRGTVGRLVTDEGLYNRLTGIGRETEQTMRHLKEAADRAHTVMENFAAPDGTAQQFVQVLRGTLADTREVISDLGEGTEALKRNFLLRGFFRQRGFFDLDAISREAYQAGALAGKARTALRIWIDAEGLFSRGPDGAEQLTEAGRRRLDSAMADLVRYPRDNPLVVEGYAESREGEAAYLVSADRAELVRDYLLSRFRRKATLTGIMAMGDQGGGSPRGDNRWSGVALALFVSNDVLARTSEGASPP